MLPHSLNIRLELPEELSLPVLISEAKLGGLVKEIP
jgi:hypothetical protein